MITNEFKLIIFLYLLLIVSVFIITHTNNKYKEPVLPNTNMGKWKGEILLDKPVKIQQPYEEYYLTTKGDTAVIRYDEEYYSHLDTIVSTDNSTYEFIKDPKNPLWKKYWWWVNKITMLVPGDTVGGNDVYYDVWVNYKKQLICLQSPFLK